MAKDHLDIGFTGDLSFSGYFKGCEGDDSLLDDGIKQFLNGNDYNVVNFESPVTSSRISKKKRLAHRCGEEALDFVTRNIKDPILSFANNHMMDFGYIGVIDTMDSCRSKDIPCIGIGLNVSEAGRFAVVGDEIKVAVLAIEYKKYLIANNSTGGPLHESRTEEIKAAISAMKRVADYVVVVYHGGEEFLNAPMPYIRRQLKRYISWGANAVVAHHPHVVQGYEVLGPKKLIIYSLGNFIFDTDYQRVQDNTENGMLVSLRFTKDGISFESLPTHIDRENHKVVCGDDRRFFNDISKGYDKLWSLEAARRKDTKARAEQLKQEEVAAREERKESERVRIEALQAAADIKEAMYDKSDREIAEEGMEAASDTDAVEEKVKKTSLHSVAKAAYKRLVVKRKDNCRAVVIKFGQLKAKTIYR